MLHTTVTIILVDKLQFLFPTQLQLFGKLSDKRASNDSVWSVANFLLQMKEHDHLKNEICLLNLSMSSNHDDDIAVHYASYMKLV